jgi:murein DD-endopeptidase MepM/ murein hydrolase activator NlpD
MSRVSFSELRAQMPILKNAGIQALSRVASAPAFRAALTSALQSPPAPHTVRSGETLYGIVTDELKKQGVTPGNDALIGAVQRVAQANHLANADRIYPGERIDMAVLGEVTRVAQGGPSLSLAKLRAASPVTSAVSAKAATQIPKVDLSGLLHTLLDPVSVAPVKPAAPATGAASIASSAKDQPWAKVLEGAEVSSTFGQRSDPFSGKPAFHDGLDLAANTGTPIHPVKAGTVEFSGWQSGYGRMVIVRHDDGTQSIYGHTSETLVRAGAKVNTSTVIAKVGSSGRSTGPHLHFEIRKNDKAVDPMPYLTQSSAMKTASR